MIVMKPEKAAIPGLRERARMLNKELGPITRKEITAAVIVFGCILVMSLRSFVPALKPVDKTAIILISSILFFVTGILDIDDLEDIPWNIILLFAGAMSIGFCLWETGAAKWLAVNWLAMFKESHWFVFVMGIAFFVMIMTNFIMNVAAIAISLPVALVIAPYLGGGRRGDPLCLPGDRRHALFAAGGRSAQCHRLRLEAVYHRRVFPLRHSGQHHPDGGGRLCGFHPLAVDGHADHLEVSVGALTVNGPLPGGQRTGSRHAGRKADGGAGPFPQAARGPSGRQRRSVPVHGAGRSDAKTCLEKVHRPL